MNQNSITPTAFDRVAVAGLSVSEAVTEIHLVEIEDADRASPLEIAPAAKTD